MQTQIETLREKLREVYEENNEKLLFHGWHHISFVSKKAKEFSESIGADSNLVESAALVHDLNYIVEKNSPPGAGAALRKETLKECGYSKEAVQRIEEIILESDTSTRGGDISEEGKALSDADTLFKALPITPVLFASRYIKENNVDIYALAEKIVSEQTPLVENDIYFYTDLAKNKYMTWARVNLAFWKNVKEALSDEDVKEMLSIAKSNNSI